MLQGGDCAESFEDPDADEPGAGPRHPAPRRAHRPHRRPVRQAALGRPRDQGRRQPAVVPRRQRQPRAVHRGGSHAGSRAAVARLRARRLDAQLRARAGRRRLRRPAPPRVLGHLVRPRRAPRRRVPPHRRSDPRGHLVRHRGHRHRRHAAQAGRLLHQPRGAGAALRRGPDPHRAAPPRLVQPVDPHAVDRHAHRRRRWRPRRVPPRHREPAGHQDRPGDDPRVADRAAGRARPRPQARPDHADPPHGRRQGRDLPARAGRGGARHRPHGAVDVRPDARQHRDHAAGREDPALRQDPVGDRGQLPPAPPARRPPRRRALRDDRRGRHRAEPRRRRGADGLQGRRHRRRPA